MDESDKSDRRWLTRRSRTWLWGYVFGVATPILGIGITWGALGGMGARLGAGAEAFSETPTTTTVPTETTIVVVGP